MKQDTPVDCTDTEGNTPLMLSCREGHGRLVKLFVRKGADVKVSNRDGLNAQQLAQHMGHHHVVKFLQELNEGPTNSPTKPGQSSALAI